MAANKENVGNAEVDMRSSSTEESEDDVEMPEARDDFDLRPSFFGGDIPRFRNSTYMREELSVQKKLEFGDFTLNQDQSGVDDHQDDKIKTYLRLRPVKTKLVKITDELNDIYKLENSETLCVTTSHLRQAVNLVGNSKYKFCKIFCPSDTQTTVYEEVVQPLVESFFQGKNCLVFNYGATNSGKTYTIQGCGTEYGMLPRALEYLYYRIDDKICKGATAKPDFFKTFQTLTPSEVKELNNTKTKILKSVKQKTLEEMHSFRNSLVTRGSNATATNEPVLIDKSAASSDPMSTSDPGETLIAVWISFAEIYNDRVYDLFDVDTKGPRRRELKLMTDRKGRVHIKGLTEVCVNDAPEAFQLFLAGKNNLKFASTQANATSSRSHSFFNVKLVFLGVSDRVVYPRKLAQMSFCDLAGMERVAQTGNFGERLKESGSINQSLFVLIKLIRAMRKQQESERSTTVLPIRESKLTKIFYHFLVNSAQTHMIVNVNPDPVMVETSLQVLQNAAETSEVLICRPVKAPVHESSFYHQLQASIVQTNEIRRRLDETMDAEETQESASPESPEYGMLTVVAKSKIPGHKTVGEVAILEEEIRRLKEENSNLEIRVRNEMLQAFEKLQEESDASQQVISQRLETDTAALNERRLSLAAQVWRVHRSTEDKSVGTSPKAPNSGNVPSSLLNSPSQDFQSEMEKNHALQIENHDLKMSCKSLGACISERNATISTMRIQLENSEASHKLEVHKLQQIIELKDQEIKNLKTEEPEKMKIAAIAQNEKLNQVLQDQISQNQEIQRDLDDAKQLCLDYHSKLAEANSKIAELSDKVNNLYKEKKTLEDDNAILHMTMESKEAQIEECKREHIQPRRSSRRKHI